MAPAMRSALARARGLGSAKEGVAHWWAQRVTAIALVPLTLWLAIGLIAHTGANHAVILSWLGSPATALLLVATLGALLYHADLGLRVVLEDYVHGEALKIAGLLVIKAAALLLFATGTLALLKIALGS